MQQARHVFYVHVALGSIQDPDCAEQDCATELHPCPRTKMLQQTVTPPLCTRCPRHRPEAPPRADSSDVM